MATPLVWCSHYSLHTLDLQSWMNTTYVFWDADDDNVLRLGEILRGQFTSLIHNHTALPSWTPVKSRYSKLDHSHNQHRSKIKSNSNFLIPTAVIGSHLIMSDG